jgi:MGT family glycosyltransferase
VGPESKTIVFFPEGAFGPTNNCVGIGSILQRAGHRVVFVVEESFRGTLEAKGFEERLIRLKPKPDVEEEPGQFWKDFIRETAPQFRRATIDQLEGLILPIWTELIDGARHVDRRLAEIFDELQPDAIVEDNVVAFPAVPASGRPWVRIVSCNPLELKDPGLPPPFSGYRSDDRGGWAEFRAEYQRVHQLLWGEFDQFVVERGAPHLDPLEFIHESAFLNLYVYPEAVDYRRARRLAPTWHRLGSSVRDTDEPFELPPGFASHGEALVYLSLGSLGSGDVELMNRLIGALSETPHRYIVSKGPQADRIRLPDGMIGSEFLPQASVLPNVDVVITHGGNNTVTECFHFGKPMVTLPLFWDQYDNAQRVDELGFGVRLAPYQLEPKELIAAIDGLLDDPALRRRMDSISDGLQARPGTLRAAELIARVARDGAAVLR